MFETKYICPGAVEELNVLEALFAFRKSYKG